MALHFGEIIFVDGEIGVDGVQRVDSKKRVILLQIRTVGKMDFRNTPGYLGLDRNHLPCDASADLVEVVGHIQRNCRGNGYGGRGPFESRRVFFRAPHKDESCNAHKTKGLPKTWHESLTPCFSSR